MGYGYGVWLVYKNSELPTKHIGHITIACFMERDEALKLYNDIISNIANRDLVYLSGKSIMFDSGFYEHDKNELYSWGYSGNCRNWHKYKEICQKYKCDFSSSPHISKEYTYTPDSLQPVEMKDMILQCDIHCVDISSDSPYEWKIIQ
jgi:hypothetical protein